MRAEHAQRVCRGDGAPPEAALLRVGERLGLPGRDEHLLRPLGRPLRRLAKRLLRFARAMSSACDRHALMRFFAERRFGHRTAFIVVRSDVARSGGVATSIAGSVGGTSISMLEAVASLTGSGRASATSSTLTGRRPALVAGTSSLFTVGDVAQRLQRRRADRRHAGDVALRLDERGGGKRRQLGGRGSFELVFGNHAGVLHVAETLQRGLFGDSVGARARAVRRAGKHRETEAADEQHGQRSCPAHARTGAFCSAWARARTCERFGAVRHAARTARGSRRRRSRRSNSCSSAAN